METLERLARRIETVGEIRSLVRTMKTLSAVNLRQFETAAAHLAVFEQTNRLGLRALGDWLRGQAVPVASPEAAPVRVLIGAERGFCGRYSDRLAEAPGGPGPTLAIGARLVEALHAADTPPEASRHLPSSVHSVRPLVARALKTVAGWSAGADLPPIEVVHMRRRPEGGLDMVRAPVWPLGRDRLLTIADEAWPSRRLPSAYGAPGPVFAALIRQRLVLSLQQACLAAMIAESAARLSAMQAANDNIDRHLAELEQTRRLRRQEAITGELMDIWSGFELTRPGG